MHLLSKLCWEARELENTKAGDMEVAAFRSLNCAVTAWCMASWMFDVLTTEQRSRLAEIAGQPIASGTQLAAWAAKQEPAIAVSEQLATRLKRFQVTRATEDTPDCFSAKSPHVSALFVVHAGSVVYDPRQLVEKAHTFWHNLVARVAPQSIAPDTG